VSRWCIIPIVFEQTRLPTFLELKGSSSHSF
jgi:hypothetical protein